MQTCFRIRRQLNAGEHRLTDIFADIRDCAALAAIFSGPEEIDQVIAETKIFLVDQPWEMFVDNDDGSITIGLSYLREASEEYLYLDIVHELCHVKQHLQGKDLYDRSKAYVDRQTEIDAYRVTVEEARHLGWNDEAIACYLQVSWITPEEHRRLARRLGFCEPGDLR